MTLIVLAGTMVAFVLQRRATGSGSLVAAMLLAGLILPPALVPTIYVLQWIGLFKTLLGLVLVEVALILPFAVLIFRTFMTAIPRELDEAAIIDGATPWQLFCRVIFPLLRPAIITVIVVASVTVYNDFVNPLYFLPGDGERHGPADAVQLPEPVQHALEPAVRGRAAHHHPAHDHVHLLPAPDRLRHDRRRRQGLRTSTAGGPR